MKNNSTKNIFALLACIMFAFVFFTTCHNPIMESWWDNQDRQTSSETREYHIVNFNVNGGDPFIESQLIVHEGKISKVPAITKAHYGFAGWFNNTSLSGYAWDFDKDTVSNDLVLFAGWVPVSYVVEFDAKGGSYEENGEEKIPAPQFLLYGTRVKEPPAINLTAQGFGGWYKDDAYTNAWNFASDTINENMKLYARWNNVYRTVTFNSNGGLPHPKEQLIALGGRVVTPPPMSLAGHFFDGWFMDEDLMQLWNFAAAVENNMTLYAKWAPIPVSVTFITNDGMPIPSAQAILAGTSAHEPVPITREGHAFGGWFDDISFNNEWDFTYPVNSNLILYARWVPRPCTVTFAANGGEPSPPNQLLVTGTMIKEPPVMSLEGHGFGGWYTSADFSGSAWNFAADKVLNDINLYARWNTLYHAVFFNSKGGFPEPSSQLVASGGRIVAPPAMSLEGYGFGGWFADEDYTQPWNFISGTVNSNMTLYAKWDTNHHTVTFVANEGTPAPAQQLVAHGSDVTTPSPMTREGFSFGGWFTDTGFTDEWSFTLGTVTEPLTLYAKWDRNIYKVLFDPKGGLPTPEPLLQFVAYMGMVTEPLPMSRDGHGFGGWFLKDGTADNDWGERWNFFSRMTGFVTEDIVLYAKWDLNRHNFTFIANGGSPAPSSQVVAFNSYATRPASMERSGHHFGGWFLNEDFSGDSWNFVNTPVTDDLTLYAWWIPDHLIVTFNANGGSPVPGVQHVISGSGAASPAPITRDGFTFGGWFSDAVFLGNAWNFSTDIVSTDMILHAKWERNPAVYTVTFEADGGTPAPNNQLVVEGVKLVEPLSMLKPFPGGGFYGFGGWFTNPAFTGEPWVFLRETVNENITLYAKWGMPVSRVIFEANEGTPAPEDQYIIQGSKVKEPLAMSREGYHFGGWFNANSVFIGNAWNFTDGIVTTDELRLYARWIPNEIPPTEIIQRVRIHGVYYVDFAGNSIVYNGPPGPGASTWLTQIQIDANNAAIQNVVNIMLAHPDFILQLSGHANPTVPGPGQPGYNQSVWEQELRDLEDISGKRANTVLNVFLNRSIPEDQMINAGYNDRLYGDGSRGSLNRTVEIIIIEYLPLK
ncbi:MAG: InlB B-repeat-containing protein [Treponema sp.]|nr:InlB B-repeat-containing protein [Treponema sp.]